MALRSWRWNYSSNNDLPIVLQSGLVSGVICGEGQQRLDFPALLARATAAMEPLCLPSLLPVSMS